MKVLWLNFPAHGSTNPSLKTLRELISRGLEITYYSSDEFKFEVESAGAIYKRYKGHINNIKHDDQKDELSLLKFMMNITLDKLESNIDDIKGLKPDFIIHDSICTWGKIIAKILDIPTLNLMHTYPMSASTMSSNLESWKIIPGALLYKIKSLLNKKSPLRLISKRFKYKVPFTDIMLNSEVCNVTYSSKHMNPELFRKDDSYIFVGPSIIQNNCDSDFPWELLENKSVIYVSLGTVTNNNIEFYKECIKAFRESEYLVVMSVGREIDFRDLGIIPDNFIVKEFVPQWKLLGRVKLFITNGGMNSVNESILNGIPMLILPDQIEKKMIANRVVEMNIGRMLDIKKVTYEKLQNSIKEVLHNNNIMDNILEYQQLFINEEKIAHVKAADGICEYISNC